ncbi:unnamed protein product, partial [Polarella glacialis]
MEMSWGTLVTDSYDILWKMIIRPPRSSYSLEDLGPVKFRIGSQGFQREDFQLKNQRGMKLECSWYRPLRSKPAQATPSAPCVVYLHGNCSSRMEALDILQVVLPKDMSVFSVDFSGSGQSEGDYISLGHFEQHDLRVVVDYLRQSGSVSAVGLWGRSMGAATSILRAAEDWELAALVVDSPFSSLPMVAQELVNSQMAVPEFMLGMALGMVRKEIQTRANFDIEELLPIKAAPRARSPCLFAVAKDDDFVLPHHTYDLHNAWGANSRKLVTFEGGHNGARPRWFLEEASGFLKVHLTAAAKVSVDLVTEESEAVPSASSAPPAARAAKVPAEPPMELRRPLQ